MNRTDRIEDFCNHIGIDVDLRDIKASEREVTAKKIAYTSEIEKLTMKMSALNTADRDITKAVLERTKDKVIEYLESISGIDKKRNALSQCIEEGVMDTDTADDLRLDWYRKKREQENYKQYQVDPKDFTKNMNKQYRNRM
jgi:hypothetical protein